ncbi:uncharacterized protein LOC106130373 isoform X2 [Amyelois transitella]|uniref:uncharacterized protein LOC106130373 isoform X2 n=1 Tax=Amyelois transitella TaxID=680683 RepID=UPI00299038D3|nr:uncharacterized protein LOC106130373 isoform X2 [Amyelois transitella]
MEVIEDGNIMDRIPILLQRDLEYYQKNQTVLSETICPGVVGGRLDFPRNASFAAVKIVIWLEDEFTIAFQHGSGMFVVTEEEEKKDGGVAKTSDPDKFVHLAIKSSDLLLEHLHVLAQEALDHADLPVLTATLGAAALLKNSLYCYVQHVEDSCSNDKISAMQACYKRYVTMSEAVAERVLDLHNRVLSLYILQDSGGRPIEGNNVVHHAGTPSVQGWWLYMNGSRKDLWGTVPPRMAQRIFAGMLNETLTILTVRYCQTNTTASTTPLLLNDILNILLCVAQLLPAICATGADACGRDVTQQPRDVRDVHAKCNELFKCLVYRGAELHFIHQVFKDKDQTETTKDGPYPWFTFVSPNLFDIGANSPVVHLSDKTAIGLELIVLLAQPQPSCSLVVKVLMMRNCFLARMLLIHAIRHMSKDNSRWPADGLWYSVEGKPKKCKGFLCTADGFCNFSKDILAGEEYARAAGALTYILTTIGSKTELKSTLCYALEISGKDWASCLDKRQTMSLCLTCISRSLDCVPRTFYNACIVIEKTLPSHINPVGGSVLLQMLITVAYEEMLNWAKNEARREKNVPANGEAHNMSDRPNRPRKHVRIVSLGNTTTSSSVSFDGSHSSPSSIALAIAEALCSIDEDDKHTQEIEQLVTQSRKTVTLSNQFGLEDFPEFAEFFEEGDVPGANAERASDAAALTSQILMTSPGRDSLRVISDHLQLHAERIYKELGIQEPGGVDIPLNKAPLLYVMFHIGRRPFDQFLRGEWPMPWSKLVMLAKTWSGIEGARVHINRRDDIRNIKSLGRSNKQLIELYGMFKPSADGVL